MKPAKRIGRTVRAAACLCALVGAGVHGDAQVIMKGGVAVRIGGASGRSVGAVVIPVDADFQRAMAGAQRYIGQKQFDQAAELLQALLSRTDVGFAATEETGRYASMALRVNEVIRSMGPEGLAQYRRQFDAKAAAMLEQAMARGDAGMLRQVATEYQNTNSGPGACDALGDLRFDQGMFDSAQRYWQQAAEGGEEAARAVRLAKRAVALQLGGRAESAKALGEEVVKRYPEAAGRLGGRERKLAEFLAWAGALPPVMAEGKVRRSETGWLGTGAVADGMAVMSDCDVVPSPQWRVTEGPGAAGGESVALMAMRPRSPGNVSYRGGGNPAVRLTRKGGHVLATVQVRGGGYELDPRGAGNPDNLLPSTVCPLVVGDLAVVRREDAVAAYDLIGQRTGKAGSLAWKSLPVPAGGVSRAAYSYGIISWPDAGTYGISSDGERAFVTGVLPQQRTAEDGAAPRPVMIVNGVPVAEEPMALLALSLSDQGKILWAVGGGVGGDESIRSGRFLGAPTVCDGRLVALMAIGEAAHLVCLDAVTGTVVWKTVIAEASARGNAGVRRMMGSPLRANGAIAVADGMVFACTGAGVVACVDVENGMALWARQYDDSGATAEASFSPAILMRPGPPPGSPMIVSGGRVICLPADRNELLVLAADDGRLIWTTPARGQTELSAIDASRVLLSGPGLVVVDVRAQKELYANASLGVSGRPAVGTRKAIASGRGEMVSLDLQTYALSRTALSGPEALLGNLVAVGGRLLAANASGLCLYVNYDDHRADLEKRMESADEPTKLALLLERGRLASQAGRYEAALADMAAVREKAVAAGRLDLAEDARAWTMRTHVAMGNRSEGAGEMLTHFQKALEEAPTDTDRAQMLERIARSHELNALQFNGADEAARREKLQALVRAVETAHALAQQYPAAPIADLPVGAAFLQRMPDETPPKIESRAWAMDVFLPALLKDHGHACYAAWDSQADAALARAQGASDVEAMLAVRTQWPNSIHVGRALLAAARTISGPEAAGEPELARSFKLLGEAEPLAGDSRTAATILAGRTILSQRRHQGPIARIYARKLRQLCQQNQIALGEPAAFDESGRSIAALLEELDGKGPASPVAAASPVTLTPGDIEPAFTVKGDGFIVRDQSYQALRQGAKVMLLQDNQLLWVDTAAADAEKALLWRQQVPLNSQTLRGNMIGAPGYVLTGGVCSDGKTALVADRIWATGVNLADGKSVWKQPVSVSALSSGSVQYVAFGQDRLIVQDYRGKAACLNARGEVQWSADLSRDLERFDGPAQVAGGLVLLRGASSRRVFCLDLATGKRVGQWPADRGTSPQFISARICADGLVAAMIDGKLSLYCLDGAKDTPAPLWTVPFDVGAQPALVGSDEERLFVSEGIQNPNLSIVTLDGVRIGPARNPALTQGQTVNAAVSAGNAVYLLIGTNIQGRRENAYNGHVVAQPMSLLKVDAATGKPLWNTPTLVTSSPASASYPVIPAGPSVIFTAGGPAYGNTMAVIVTRDADGRPGTALDVFGNSQPAARRLGGSDYARRRSVGPAVLTEGGLCVEDLAGVTVYRPRVGPKAPPRAP